MTDDSGFRKYIEAGAVLGQLTRARAEEIVRELVGAGEVQRDQAQQWVDDLLERSRKATDDLVDFVRHEVSSQLSNLGLDPEHLATQAADILRRTAVVGRQAAEAARTAAGRSTPPGKGSSATNTAKKTAPAKKTAANKAPAKKKASAKKAPAKKAAKATGTKKASGKKKAPAKKAAAKKATTR